MIICSALKPFLCFVSERDLQGQVGPEPPGDCVVWSREPWSIDPEAYSDAREGDELCGQRSGKKK